MEETANNILMQIPKPVSLEEVSAKYPVLYEQSMNTVLLQEVIRCFVITFLHSYNCFSKSVNVLSSWADPRLGPSCQHEWALNSLVLRMMRTEKRPMLLDFRLASTVQIHVFFNLGVGCWCVVRGLCGDPAPDLHIPESDGLRQLQCGVELRHVLAVVNAEDSTQAHSTLVEHIHVCWHCVLIPLLIETLAGLRRMWSAFRSTGLGFESREQLLFTS